MLKENINRLQERFNENYHKLMTLPDAPNKIAGGMAVGVAMLFLPIPIIGYPLTYFIAWLLGFNGLAALLTLILFKWAAPFFFAIDVMVGFLLLTGQLVPIHVFASNFNYTSIDAWVALGKTMGQPILIGAIVNSLVMCTLVYIFSHRYIENRQGKYKNKQLK